jgi:predicted Rossmann-fold nucleotide-binding protein
MTEKIQDSNLEINSGKIEDTLENRANFKVSIFGTGGDKTKHDLMAIFLANQLAREIVKDGQHKIISGGYEGGIMGEASKAAYKQAQEMGRNDLIPEGITLGDKLGKKSEQAIITETETLPERLHNLIDKSNAVVVLHGKTGTVVELITTLWAYGIENLKNRNNKNYTPKPTIIVDSSSEHTDLLSLLNKRDPDKFKIVIDNIYALDISHVGPEPAINTFIDDIKSIIEIYYKKSLQEKISEEEKKLLEKLSFKKFLETQEEAKNNFKIKI